MRKVIHPNFPEYLIRDDGFVERRIDSAKYQKAGDLLQGRVLQSGYRQFKLKDRTGQQIEIRANRLVCEAFNGVCPSPSHQAAHNNGRRLDNRPENLRWATPKENIQDRIDHGHQAQGETSGAAKLTEYQVRLMRAQFTGEIGQIAHIARKFGISHGGASAVLHGRTWKHVSNMEAL